MRLISALCCCILMNPTLLHSFFPPVLHYPRALAHVLNRCQCCLVNKICPAPCCCTVLLYDTALLCLCCQEGIFKRGVFWPESWSVLMNHVMFSTTKLFLEACFCPLQSPYHAIISASSWFTTSFSRPSVTHYTFSLPCCCCLISFSDTAAALSSPSALITLF